MLKQNKDLGMAPSFGRAPFSFGFYVNSYRYKEGIRDIIKQLCFYKGVEIIEGLLKGKNILKIFDKHANRKYKYGNRHFEAEVYYMGTMDLDEVKACIFRH